MLSEGVTELQCWGLLDDDTTGSEWAKPIVQYGTSYKNVYYRIKGKKSLYDNKSKTKLEFTIEVSEDRTWSVNYKTKSESYDWAVYRWSEDGDTYLKATVNGSTVQSKTKVSDPSKFDSVANKVADAVACNTKCPEEFGLSGIKSYDIDGYIPDRDDIDWMYDYEGEENADVLDGTITYTWEEADHTQIYVRHFTTWKPNDIEFSINKKVLDLDKYSGGLRGLENYDLTGTEFEVYADQTSTTSIIEKEPKTLKISGNGGSSNTVKIPAQYGNKTVYLQEKLPANATGYKTEYSKPGSRLEIKLGAAGTKQLNEIVYNPPIHDPLLMTVTKNNNLTDSGEYVGNKVTLDEIEYTLSYFEDNKSNATSNSSPERTWKFKTDDKGMIRFTKDDYFVSGNELFRYNGDITYPAGWYRLEETADDAFLADKGLKRDKSIYYVHIERDKETGLRGIKTIYRDGTGDANIVTNKKGEHAKNLTDVQYEADITEDEHWEKFGIVKYDKETGNIAQGDAKLTGAVYGVYCTEPTIFDKMTSDGYNGHIYTVDSEKRVCVDNTPMTITIDETGFGVTKYALPKDDRFYIQEIKAPVGYKLDTNKYKIDMDNKQTLEDNNGNDVSISYKDGNRQSYPVDN